MSRVQREVPDQWRTGVSSQGHLPREHYRAVSAAGPATRAWYPAGRGTCKHSTSTLLVLPNLPSLCKIGQTMECWTVRIVLELVISVIAGWGVWARWHPVSAVWQWSISQGRQVLPWLQCLLLSALSQHVTPQQGTLHRSPTGSATSLPQTQGTKVPSARHEGNYLFHKDNCQLFTFCSGLIVVVQVNIYCKTCQSLGCLLCADDPSSHQNHQVLSLSQAVSAIRVCRAT